MHQFYSQNVTTRMFAEELRVSEDFSNMILCDSQLFIYFVPRLLIEEQNNCALIMLNILSEFLNIFTGNEMSLVTLSLVNLKVLCENQ